MVGALGTLLLALSSPATAPAEVPARLHCDVGPLDKTFGGHLWIIYSCSDERSLVILSGKNNPATPFVFMIRATDDGYAINGEGNGARSVTSAAFEEIKLLTKDDIAALVLATKGS